MVEVILYGRGGQGAASGVAMLAAALSYEGKYVQAFPAYGFERRGAPVRAFLRIDEVPIILRGPIYKANCIVVLDPRLPDTIDVTANLAERGIAVMNTTKAPENIDLKAKPSRIGVVDAIKISEAIFGPMALPVTNVIMLGAFCATTEWVSLSSVVEAVKGRFKGSLLEKNEEALRTGYEATKVFRGQE